MPRPATTLAPSPIARRLPLLSALAIAALTTLVCVLALQRERQRARLEFEGRARAVARSLDDNVALPLESLRAVSALMRVEPNVEAPKFQQFTRTLMAHHPSLAALEWAELVDGERRAQFESDHSARLGRSFRVREPGPEGAMVPSPVRDRHLVLLLLEPPLQELVGLDVRFEPSRRAAVDLALERRDMLATSKFRLVEDPPHVFSIAVYDPIVDAGAVRGTSIALYRLEPLAKSALAEVDLTEVAVALLDDDPSLPAEDRLLFESRAGAESLGRGWFTQREPLSFAGRSWTVVVSEPVRVDTGAIWIIALVGGAIAISTGLWLSGREARAALERALRRERELGEYTLVSKLGEGGMGAVYEARHRLLRRRVAIKIIHPERAGPDLVERFAREAQTTAELSHPNTVRVFDYGVSEDGRLFLVMEHLHGITLEALVEQHGPQPPERVRHLIMQACDALAEAHDAGVIHRDIKPANLMLCRVGGRHDFVKVLDFGLAKVDDSADVKLSAPGAILGTFSCMAPECLTDSTAASARSDLYALGCVAYYLLAGHDVFAATTETALLSAHLVGTPEPLPRGVPSSLGDIVLRCLAKDPDERYQTARQLAHALGALDLPPWSEADAAAWWDNADTDSAGPASRPLTHIEALRPRRRTPSA